MPDLLDEAAEVGVLHNQKRAADMLELVVRQGQHPPRWSTKLAGLAKHARGLSRRHALQGRPQEAKRVEAVAQALDAMVCGY